MCCSNSRNAAAAVLLSSAGDKITAALSEHALGCFHKAHSVLLKSKALCEVCIHTPSALADRRASSHRDLHATGLLSL